MGTDGRSFPPDQKPKSRLHEQLDALHDRLEGRDSPLPDFREGLAVQEVVEELLARGSTDR